MQFTYSSGVQFAIGLHYIFSVSDWFSYCLSDFGIKTTTVPFNIMKNYLPESPITDIISNYGKYHSWK